MSQWTHAICNDCWDERNPDRPSSRIRGGDDEICCWCGRPTSSGIYLRDDPTAVPHVEAIRPVHEA